MALPALLIPIIGAVAALGSAGLGYAATRPQDVCKKDCKEECRATTGWLFSGRQKCIKECRATNCVTPPLPPTEEQEKTKVNWYLIGGGLLVVAIIIYIALGRKK